MRADELTLVHGAKGAFFFSTWRNLTLNVWASQGTPEAMRRLTTVTRKMMAAHPGGFSTIHVVLDSAGLPDAQVRAAFVRLTSECARELACVAIILGGTGFWASALRATVTGIWQAVPKTFDMRICGTGSEVVDWLPAKHANRTGTQLEPDRLRAVIEQASLQALDAGLIHRSA